MGPRMHVTATAIEAIKAFEDFRPDAYICPAGRWTVGYGTTRWDDGELVQPGDSVDHAEAEHQLAAHIGEEVEPALDRIFPGQNLDAGMRDALASFIHNIGSNYLEVWPTLASYIRNGAPRDVICDQLLEYKNGGGKPLLGLYRRRLAECCMIHGVDWRPALDASWDTDWRDLVGTVPVQSDDNDLEIPAFLRRGEPKPEPKPQGAETMERTVQLPSWYDELTPRQRTEWWNQYSLRGKNPTLQQVLTACTIKPKKPKEANLKPLPEDPVAKAARGRSKVESGKEGLGTAGVITGVTVALPVVKETTSYFDAFPIGTILLTGLAFAVVAAAYGTWRWYAGRMIEYEAEVEAEG